MGSKALDGGITPLHIEIALRSFKSQDYDAIAYTGRDSDARTICREGRSWHTGCHNPSGASIRPSGKFNHSSYRLAIHPNTEPSVLYELTLSQAINNLCLPANFPKGAARCIEGHERDGYRVFRDE